MQIKVLILLAAVAIILPVTSGFLFWRKPSKPIDPEQVEKTIGVKYIIDDIPIDSTDKRPDIKRKVKYIVIHNTANPTSNAKGERSYLTNKYNQTSTSYNIVLDENEIVEVIPLNEKSHHSATEEGNMYGIGIELCESGDFEKTKENAAKLTAYLMHYYKIPKKRVKTHHDFSGKYCPRLMLETWDEFIEQVMHEYNSMKI